MTRDEQLKNRAKALRAIKLIVKSHKRYYPPSYKNAADELNALHLKTTWGNEWTPQRLLRFLQRLGYSGLHGVQAELKTSKCENANTVCDNMK